MLEAIALVSTLLVLTLAFTLLYSRRIRDAHRKYAKAKGIIDEIITSFNRQLDNQNSRVENVKKRIDVVSGRNLITAEELEKQEKKIEALRESLKSRSPWKGEVSRIDNLEKELAKASLSKETILKKLAEVEKQDFRENRRMPEPNITSAIPIKREKALAPLTETELKVLELLAAEGEKTAPEVRELIKLSREHTARLMKKLYGEGYLERSAIKVPFTYHLNEEMRKILKKPEQKS